MTDNHVNEELWYWSKEAQNAPYLPTFKVLDTESSHGRYATQPKLIHGIDIVRFHGHPCDGLFRGMYAISQALAALFPSGVIDRTDLRFLSRNSPCLGDVGAYLTGGRVRFGTQDITNRPGVWYIVQRISTGEAVEVTESEGFFPNEIMALESQLSSLSGNEQVQAVSYLKQLQDEWVNTRLFLSKPEEHYMVRPVHLEWDAVPYEKRGTRTDVLYKNVPMEGE